MDKQYHVILSAEYKAYIESGTERLRQEVNDALRKQGCEFPNMNTMSNFTEIVKLLNGSVELVDSLPAPAMYVPGKDNKPFVIQHREYTPIQDLAHELGHHCLHPDETASLNGSENPLGEIEVNYFAKCFLLPRDEFKNAIIRNSRDGQCNIELLANEFSVPYWLAESRGYDLGIWGEQLA